MMPALPSVLFFRRSEWSRIPYASSCGSTEDLADTGAAAMYCGAACASADRKQVGRRPQLPGGDCSGTKNSHGRCCQECVFDCLAHGSLSFFFSNMPHAGLCLVLFPWTRDPGQLRRTKCGGRCGEGTDAIGSRTRPGSAAGAAAGRSLDAAPQLPCGNRPYTQNSNSDDRK